MDRRSALSTLSLVYHKSPDVFRQLPPFIYHQSELKAQSFKHISDCALKKPQHMPQHMPQHGACLLKATGLP